MSLKLSLSLHGLLALAAALICHAALAQETVVITGNPLGRAAGARPASVLAGEELALRRTATLGETLDGLPGVSGSGFGPNSSRPVIRGLDGDRVRLLDNGGASIDASNLSFDHAVAMDPLVLERLEVLRGPAALLYGGNATGGVVNAIDNRIPRAQAPGLSGRAEVRLGGAASERAGATVVEGGSGALAWHADAFGRQAGHLRTPRYTPMQGGAPLAGADNVRNSAARSAGGAAGASWVARQGYLGASVETLSSRYGVTVEPEVSIRMQRDRLALAGELRNIGGPITQISAQASHTRYRHDEVEGNGEIGTTFSSRGDDLRMELHHAALGRLEGVLGLQAESLRFSALGAEAFVPGTRTRSTALFVLEELPWGPAVLSAGARAEQVRVASAGDAADATEPRFGRASERRYAPTSWSMAARAQVGAGWQLSASVGGTQRAPAYYELFANGVHLATAAFERGDARLPLERSRHTELGLGWSQGSDSLKVSLFSTRFASFIALDATGAEVLIPGLDGEPDTRLPEYAFRAVRARMGGLELEARKRLFEGRHTLDASLGIDTLRGDNLDAAEPLPRLAPQRLRAGLEAGSQAWRGGVSWRHSARQGRVPATDVATPAYTVLDLWVSGRLPGVSDLTWFAKLTNAGDRLGYNASAVATVRGLAPLPGRALAVGLRISL